MAVSAHLISVAVSFSLPSSKHFIHVIVGYSEARARTSSSKEVVMDKMVVCNAGRARYLLDTALNNHYSISNDFYYAVKNLPASYVETSYMNFIEKWGTVSLPSVLLIYMWFTLLALLLYTAHHCGSRSWRKTN